MSLPFISDWLEEYFAVYLLPETNKEPREIQGIQAQLLDIILSASPHQFYIVDHRGRWLYVNQASRQFISQLLQTAELLTLSDIFGKTQQELGLPQEIIDFHTVRQEQVWSTGASLTDETYCKLQDSTHYYEYNFIPLYDPQNSINAILVTGQDITLHQTIKLNLEQVNQALEHKLNQHQQDIHAANQRIEAEILERQQVENALLERESHYRLVVESVKDIIFKTDITGALTFLNPTWSELTGFKIADCLDQPFFNYIHPSDRERYRQEFQALITKQKEECHQEIRYYTQEGEERWFEVFSQLIFDHEGSIIGTCGVLNDITDRRQADAKLLKTVEIEKQLNELKSRFLAMISHEFRTPLTTILSSTGLLKRYRENLSEEKKLTHLERIQASVETMTQMLNDILLLGETESGQLEFQITPIEIGKFCRKLVDKIPLRYAKSPTIQFSKKSSSSSEADVDINVSLDEKILELILGNLLSNAIKYSPTASTINFELIGEETTVTFIIRDQGIGIPEKDQLRLFESFHRGKNVGTIPGTGLGLAIVKNLVELQGGTITIESQVDIGTTVTLTLPIQPMTA